MGRVQELPIRGKGQEERVLGTRRAVEGLEPAVFGAELVGVDRTLVCRVDPDGNEVAGIRLPDIAVPLAAYTGWNEYKSPYPIGEIADRDGSYFAFLPAKIAQRYTNRADYVAKVIEISNANTAAAIDFFAHLLGSKSMTDVFSLSAAQAHKAFDTASAQSKDLLELAQKLATQTSEPIRKRVAKVFHQGS